ncbi:hypothetical protein TNCV_2085631 [Trichonephila clavipes]|nr:hypothetical protein TNCV_2085631 [Trichonephila clavipes]
MDLGKYLGPYGIHGDMIEHLGPHGMQRHLDLFNFPWRMGQLLREWRRAIIISILKMDREASSPESF